MHAAYRRTTNESQPARTSHRRSSMPYAMRNLLVAVVLAIVGLILMTSYVRTQRSSITKGQSRVDVLVAAKEIPAGTRASALEKEGFVKTKSVLRDDAQPQALRTLKDVSKLSVRDPIYPGGQLTAHAFETQSNLALAAQSKGNERTFTIKLGGAGSVAGQVKVGDHVDIMFSGEVKQSGTNESAPATCMVARDVPIVGTPESLNPTQDAQPAKADGTPGLFLVSGTDQVAQALIWAQSFADDNGLIALLRPSSGALETKLDCLVKAPNSN
jgi:pilus assembly protein CpaB